MKRSFAALVLIGFALMVGTTTVQSGEKFKLEEGFVRLDNGKDLSGWTGKKEGWSVQDGAIHLDSKKARGHIFSEKKHSKNCVIRMQFRAAKRADSGVYIYGKQLQVRDYPTAGPRQYAKAAKPAGEWNELEFDIKDGVAKVTLNGQVIEKSWRIGNSAKGIGLQRERGDFDFRYIRVMER